MTPEQIEQMKAIAATSNDGELRGPALDVASYAMDLEAEVLRLREALGWYEVQVSCFARATDETADFAENTLDRDAGKIARAALKGYSHETL